MRHHIISILTAMFLPFINQIFADNPSETPLPPSDKDYHFFVGVDLSADVENESAPIIGVQQKSALFDTSKGVKPQEINTLGNLSIKKTTKVSKDFVEVIDLSCNPVFSIQNDPGVKLDRQMLLQMEILADANEKYDAMLRQSGDQTTAEILGVSNSGDVGSVEMDPDQEQSVMQGVLNDALDQVQFSESYFQDSSMGYDPSGEYLKSDGSSAWDMLAVKFHIKSNKTLQNAFMFLILELKDTKDGEATSSWFHFRQLRNIKVDANKVSYRVSSFPDGKFIDSHQLYIFSNGQEIPTNLSSKRVDMTREEAKLFMNFKYQSVNSNQTKGPELVWKYLASEISDIAEIFFPDAAVELAIDAQGNVTDIKYPKAYRKDMTPSFLDSLKDLMFYPALEDGEPIPSKYELVFKNHSL